MNKGQILTSTLMGMSAGLASTWIMTKSQYKLQALEKKLSHQNPQEENQDKKKSEDPSTVKVADKASEIFLNHHLKEENKSKAGNFVHYAFGTALGGVYGALNYRKFHTTFSSGLAYGAIVWIFADNIMLPLLGFSKTPNKYPLKTHVYALGSHLIYGGALGKLNQLTHVNFKV